VPVSSIYTDSFNTSLGTSFSTPLVAGVAALVLSVQPTMTPKQVRQLLQGTARPFPPLGSISSSSTAPQCTAPQYNLLGRPIDQLECYCTTTTCGAGMLDAGAALVAAESAASGSVSSSAPRTRRGPG
jgi:serine protease